MESEIKDEVDADILQFRVLYQKSVPIWEKANLTLEEASLYSGIGKKKLREITDVKGCEFVFFVGSKRLIKRRLFDKYIESVFSI